MWRTPFIIACVIGVIAIVTATMAIRSYIASDSQNALLQQDIESLHAQALAQKEWAQKACETRIQARGLVCKQSLTLMRNALQLCKDKQTTVKDLTEKPEQLVETLRDLLRSLPPYAPSP